MSSGQRKGPAQLPLMHTAAAFKTASLMPNTVRSCSAVMLAIKSSTTCAWVGLSHHYACKA